MPETRQRSERHARRWAWLLAGLALLMGAPRASACTPTIACLNCQDEGGGVYTAEAGQEVTFRVWPTGCTVLTTDWQVDGATALFHTGPQFLFPYTFPEATEPDAPHTVRAVIEHDSGGATIPAGSNTLSVNVTASAFTVNILPTAGCTVMGRDGGVDDAEPDSNGIVCSGGMTADDPLCTEQFQNSQIASLKVVPDEGYGFNGWIVDGAYIELTSADPLFLTTMPVMASNGLDVQVKNGSTDVQTDCSLHAFTLYTVNNGGAVSEKEKANTGTYLSINHDDDDTDGTPDNENTIIDGDEDRRDFGKITLKAAGQTETFTLNTDISNVVRLFDEAGTAKTLPVPVTPAELASGLTYWVEGLAAETVFLSVKNASGTLEDNVKLVVGEEIGIKLTFDDGPYVANDLTKKVLTTLANNSVQDGIKATFFVQTHAVPGGGSSGGPELIAETGAVHQHHVEVHTGAKEGHISHVKRVILPAEDADGDGVADGENALESDLIRAKALIYDKTGRMPVLVRPTYGDYGKDKPEGPLISQTYARQHLTMQLWTVDTQDWKDDDALIIANLSNTGCGGATCGIPYWIRKGKTSIVLLFHDIHENTVDNLEKYLTIIEDLAQHHGRNVRFEQF